MFNLKKQAQGVNNRDLVNKILQQSKILNINAPQDVINSQDPNLMLQFLQELKVKSDASSDKLKAISDMAQKQELINQQLLSQQQQAQNGVQNANATASTKSFNLKKFAQIENSVSPEVKPELKFKSFAQFSDWLNGVDPTDPTAQIVVDFSQARQELIPHVSNKQQQVFSNMLQTYLSGASNDEKPQFAAKMWGMLNDSMKDQQAQTEQTITNQNTIKQNNMEQNTNPENIENEVLASVKNTEELLMKLAQSDAKKESTKSFNLKTAQFNSTPNNSVVMYGPSEKRFDPFLRQPVTDWNIVERNKGFGLVIDDVWNIDYEAVWRGNIMDKYSAAYRDKDGKWVGGYLNKRFETDSWIPEGSQLQLKPGQRRWQRNDQTKGLIEGRMQAAREKAAKVTPETKVIKDTATQENVNTNFTIGRDVEEINVKKEAKTSNVFNLKTASKKKVI